MKSVTYDVLYLTGSFDYGDSESGNYLLYKCLETINDVNVKIILLSGKTNKPYNKNITTRINNIDLKLLSDTELLKIIPAHKILILNSADLLPRQIRLLSDNYNNTTLYYLMTHDLLGNGSSYPELDNSFNGEQINDKIRFLNGIALNIICASTHSMNIVTASPFYNFDKTVIPLPFDEIPSVTTQADPEITADQLNLIANKAQSINNSSNLPFLRNIIRYLTNISDNSNSPAINRNGYSIDAHKKKILWGTTQPNTPRKGLHLFNKILEIIGTKYPNAAQDIQIITAGPTPDIIPEFNHINLGSIRNREQLSLVYNFCDVFACTTLSDAGPMMVVESIKNNCPVIGFDRSILIDLIAYNKNGIVIAELDLDNFADKLYESLFVRKIEIDHELITKFNSQESVTRKWEMLIKRILNHYSHAIT